jgi:hypothetical protein
MSSKIIFKDYIWCSFKLLFKAGVEETIVNAPLVSVHSKTTNNAKSEVKFKSMIRNPWSIHNRLFNANFEEKFK